MHKKLPVVFLPTLSFAIAAALPVCAVAMPVDENMQNHYLTLPPTYGQPASAVVQPSVSAGGAVVYSPQEYPTAQGRYLALPQGYSGVPSSAPSAPPLVQAQTRQLAQQVIQTPPSPPPQPQYYSSGGANAYPTIAAPPAQPAPMTYEQLPSYTYDRNLDPRYVPKRKPPELQDLPDHIGLATTTGGEFGLQISSYRYQEFDPSGQRIIRITGPSLGLTLEGNEVYNSGWFIGGGVRVAYGLHDYTGGDVNLFNQTITPSTHNDIGDLLVEGRFLGGHDFIIHGAFWNAFDLGLSPYAGLGFRYLYNDSEGDDSNGVPGYERYSHYFYLPIGITPRVRLAENLRLSTNMEFDELLYGWQVSSLGEAISGAGDLTNTQSRGYGLRGSMMLEWPSWALGPFFNFWDIGQSNTACDSNNVACGYEPHNQTIEYGLQGKYRF